jgi:hypothetical protein
MALFRGTSGDDRIIGTNTDFDFVNSFGGNDWIDLRLGFGRAHAGMGNDYMTAGVGARVDFFGGPGSDTFDLRKAGPSRAWAGDDPTAHDDSPSNWFDVDTFRLNPTARGQIVDVTGAKKGSTVVVTGVDLNKHHIDVDSVFRLELEHARFVRYDDGYMLQSAVIQDKDGAEIRLHFAEPSPGGNPVFDERPDWQGDDAWNHFYGWGGPEGQAVESEWFGFLT